MDKRWIVKETGNQNTIIDLKEELGISTVLSTLLVQRGINSFDEAKSFFRPQLSDLHDPFLMQDMDKAVDRLNNAIINKEKILIYGDYDVDGTTSVALVYSFLKDQHQNIGYYIPDRYLEGYGISIKGIDYAKENDFSLIIALDCGIKAIEKVDYASTLGIDFIICDHHRPGDSIPKAVATLDPKRIDCEYPFKELSGCGVGFKLMHAFSIKNSIPLEVLYEKLDLVTVSIASDIVPVVGENRILAHYGLKQLNTSPSIGLKSIIEIAGIKDSIITVNDVVFKIGPRINAAGRIESGSQAVDLLTSTDTKYANEIADQINNLNSHRKELDHSITIEAIANINESEDLKNRKSTVIYNPEWHKGVIGIVASRLIETFYRPTIVLTLSNGLITGSARSVQGFDVYKAIDKCSSLLENFGGHMYAAGLSLKPENLEKFSEQFENAVTETILPEQLVPKINVDAIISLDDINPKFFRILEQLQPFGPENMRPIFVTENVKDTGHSKIVGATGEHLKISVTNNGFEKAFSGIAFSQAKHLEKIKESEAFNLCYSVEENTYRGNTTLQLAVRDIKF